ncbi:MAG: hypothetical protein BJ554DRAFT_7746 [Olpidium bornovanus]|uniref:Yippee domain-containing protein n=1 Tax=Olpidium bornovanus TaxID=278681 RepID=A0A8H8DM72_9FUNG|nr:MAG: hypothetical protein BJ554DRAFT_7746 [Olpidium bornovanus]
MTGRHTVADIKCVNCQTVLGWKYVSGQDPPPPSPPAVPTVGEGNQKKKKKKKPHTYPAGVLRTRPVFWLAHFS